MDRNLNWIVRILPENCNNMFVCVDEELFDEKIKHGMIPLHDGREHKTCPVPCFIGYMPTSDLTDLDKLAGIPKTTQEQAPAIDLRKRAETQNPIQEIDNERK